MASEHGGVLDDLRATFVPQSLGRDRMQVQRDSKIYIHNKPLLVQCLTSRMLVPNRRKMGARNREAGTGLGTTYLALEGWASICDA
jgi:hypothetical protein